MERRTTSQNRHVYAEGITAEVLSQHTIIGRARTVRAIKKWEWLFLGVSMGALLAAAILTLYRMFYHDPDSFSSTDFTFSLLLLLNIGFCVLYVFHGIMKERAYEILVFSATIVIVLVYCIINYTLGQHRGILKLGRLILVCSLGPVLAGCGLYLAYSYHTSNYLVYHTVGANTALQKMCRRLFFCSSLLKFDLQLQASMLILVLEKGTDIDTLKICILVGGLVITVVWIITGFLANKYEKTSLAGIFFFLSLFEPGYLLYKMGIMKGKGSSLTTTTLTCGILGLIIWGLSILVMVLVVRNYGKGLREKVYEHSSSGTPQPASKTNSVNGEPSSSPVSPEAGDPATHL